jgi:hypothetical protein
MPFGKPRFYPGRRVESLHDLVELIRTGCWVYWRDGRPLNPKIAWNMSLGTLRCGLANGNVRVAMEMSERRPLPPPADPEFEEVLP